MKARRFLHLPDVDVKMLHQAAICGGAGFQKAVRTAVGSAASFLLREESTLELCPRTL